MPSRLFTARYALGIMLHRLISRQSHLLNVLWFQLVIIIQVHGYVNDDNEMECMHEY